MKREMFAKVGDVLRYDHSPGSGAYSDPPIWVLVTCVDPAMGIVLSGAWHSDSRIRYKKPVNIGGFSPAHQWDGRVVAPPEEWPDEVCRAVALYNLTGDIS